MRTLHVIMPMAGRGARFEKEGWETPKPLIEVQGVPIFMRAINSIISQCNSIPTKFSFIVRRDHLHYGIEQCILSRIPDASVFCIDSITRGPVETCLVAEPTITDDDAVIIVDCDLEFFSDSFFELLKSDLCASSYDHNGGVLLSFESLSPRYSYAEVNKCGLVTRTAEKMVISNHALCGAYYFSSGACLKRVAHRMIVDPKFADSELYVSSLYNYMIQAGYHVRLARVDKYRSFGTPEEICSFI